MFALFLCLHIHENPYYNNTADLFPVPDVKLIELLKGLSESDWHRPTLARQWTVKAIAAHLLDGNLRSLSTSRDDFFGEPPDADGSYENLVRYLNRLNADWVKAAKRLSPNVLIMLLEISGKEYCSHIQSLLPFEQAVFLVAWAGQSESPNWVHVAREYREKWHHQQQIRQAVNKPEIIGKGAVSARPGNFFARTAIYLSAC